MTWQDVYGMKPEDAMKSGQDGMSWHRMTKEPQQAFDAMIMSSLSDVQEMVNLADGRKESSHYQDQARKRLNIVKLWIMNRETLLTT